MSMDRLMSSYGLQSARKIGHSGMHNHKPRYSFLMPDAMISTSVVSHHLNQTSCNKPPKNSKAHASTPITFTNAPFTSRIGCLYLQHEFSG